MPYAILSSMQESEESHLTGARDRCFAEACCVYPVELQSRSVRVTFELQV